MQTAARAVTSSASSTSSCVNASGWLKRVKAATPRVVPRAWSGTERIEWMPNSRICRARVSSTLSHGSSSPEDTEAMMLWPAISESAWGAAAG